MTDYNPIVLNYLSKEEKKVLMEGKLDEKEKVMQSYHIRMSDITMENVQQESNKLRGLLGDHC